MVLAYLTGHQKKSRPIFLYVTDTSTLVSADCFNEGESQPADILLWDFFKDIMQKFSMNPPWSIAPTRRVC